MTRFASSSVTPEMDTDGFSVYVLHAANSSKVGLSVDGVAITEFTIAPSPAGIQKFSISTTLAPHTYRVHWVAGFVYHLGMEATVSGSKGHRLRHWQGRLKGGRPDKASPLDAQSHVGDSLSVAVDKLAPDLSIIAFGHNDYLQQSPIATFKADMQKLITRCKAKGR